MILIKDTTLRATIKGIEILLTFGNDGMIISFEELNSVYLSNVTLNQIQCLCRGAKSTLSCTVKAVITIRREYFNKVINKCSDSFNQLVYNCLIDPQYMQYLTLVIVGDISDVDDYDEFYDCRLCKYFYNFYRVPKMKLRENIIDNELEIIINGWLDNYLFDNILIDGKDTFYILKLCNKKIINKDQINWKSLNGIYSPYIIKDHFLTPIDFTNIRITQNDHLPYGVIYSIRDKIIGNNVENIILDSKDSNIEFINGNFISKGSVKNG